jgi:DNA-binding IclR family transcriptional regulator
MEKLHSQERVLVIVEKLVEQSVEGMSNKALAFELKTLEANIYRDLKVFEARGWVEKSKTNGGWLRSLEALRGPLAHVFRRPGCG